MTSKSNALETGSLIEPVAQRVRRHFDDLLEARGYLADTAQLAAVEQLGGWLGERLEGRSSWFKRRPAGVYLWGGVGRGKSFVMDAFFAAAPIEGKRRVHFHAFLQELQVRMLAFSGQADPLARVAREIAERTQLLCFDEFHVHDIGDAMLLGRLLKVLEEEGVGLVCTSNYSPDKLCPNPLYRERFQPAIALIEKRFVILSVDGGEDYRLRSTALEAWGHFYWPEPGPTVEVIPQQLGLVKDAAFAQVLEVNHHPLHIHAHDERAAWLDFAELFATPRSAADYLWLIERFPRIAVTGLDCLGSYPQDVSQRFLNFIDIAYDRRLQLHLYSRVALEQLAEGGSAVDFSRTLSRLRQLEVVVLAEVP